MIATTLVFLFWAKEPSSKLVKFCRGFFTRIREKLRKVTFIDFLETILILLRITYYFPYHWIG